MRATADGSEASNVWRLRARLVERQPLRLTPAGVPALDCVLEHTSSQIEAGQVRSVQARVRAVCIGPLAETLGRFALGSQAEFFGFLAGTARTTKSGSGALLFHLQELRDPVMPDTLPPSESSESTPIPFIR